MLECTAPQFSNSQPAYCNVIKHEIPIWKANLNSDICKSNTDNLYGEYGLEDLMHWLLVWLAIWRTRRLAICVNSIHTKVIKFSSLNSKLWKVMLNVLTSTPPVSLRVWDNKARPLAVACALASIASASPGKQQVQINIGPKWHRTDRRLQACQASVSSAAFKA